MFLEEARYPALLLPRKSSLTAIPSPGWRVRMVVMVLVVEKSAWLAEEDWPVMTGSPPAPRSTRRETLRAVVSYEKSDILLTLSGFPENTTGR